MDQIGTGTWFLSVVVTGLLINLASAYLKPRLDAVLLRSSGWWRSRSAAQLAARDAYVRVLLRDEHELERARFRVVSAMLNPRHLTGNGWEIAPHILGPLIDEAAQCTFPLVITENGLTDGSGWPRRRTCGSRRGRTGICSHTLYAMGSMGCSHVRDRKRAEAPRSAQK